MYSLHPNLKINIKNNLNILSSTFDVYETMTDVLNANYDGHQRNLSNRGLSQLYPIPKNRTCKSAGIPNHYCTCLKQIRIAENHPLAIEGAKFLVDQLNTILRNYSDVCRIISISKILYVRKISIDNRVKFGVNSYKIAKQWEGPKFENKTKSRFADVTKTVEKLEIGIETEPFSAQFEALIQSEIKSSGRKSWSVDGTISRINKYDGLSNCVDDKNIRKYCSCKV